MRCAGAVAVFLTLSACADPTVEVQPVRVIVAAGASHTCATNGTTTWCWGKNVLGQLGIGAADASIHSTPTQLTGAPSFAYISAGEFRTCALTTDGHAYCWGDGTFGALGTGDTLSHASPTAVSGGHQFLTISVGTNHVCALKSTGDAFCWGYGVFGQLGNGGIESSSVPIAAGGGLKFTTLSAGETHTCGTNVSGAWCWGVNAHGALGSGQLMSTDALPAAVSGGTLISSVSAGFRYSCGIAQTGAALCWGLNWTGQLGADTPNSCIGFSDDFLPCSQTPIAVPTVALGTIVAGQFHTCALATGGAPYCWGSNSAGQLGDGNASGQSRQAPAKVAGELFLRGISVGASHTCGVAFDNAVYCWGNNLSGQLGTGNTNSRLAPVQITLP